MQFLPPPSPWYGPAPDLPSSGLPVYGWLTAVVMLLLGSGAWVGRLVSVVASLLAVWRFLPSCEHCGCPLGPLRTIALFGGPIERRVGPAVFPSAVILAAQALTLLALVRWRALADARAVGNSRATGAPLPFWLRSFARHSGPGRSRRSIPCAACRLYYHHPPRRGTQFTIVGRYQLGRSLARSRYRGHAVGIIVALAGSCCCGGRSVKAQRVRSGWG